MENTDRDKKEEICEEQCKEDRDVSVEGADDAKSHREEELEKQLEQLERERDEHLALAQRVQADFANFKRRNENTSAKFYDGGVGEAVLAFLPVLDNLDRALCSMEEGGCPEAFVEGIEMVKKQFNDVLTKLQVEEIEALGKPFDPEFHHAVAQEDAQEGQEENTVIEVLQKGYKHKDRVLRYSMVKVAK